MFNEEKGLFIDNAREDLCFDLKDAVILDERRDDPADWGWIDGEVITKQLFLVGGKDFWWVSPYMGNFARLLDADGLKSYFSRELDRLAEELNDAERELSWTDDEIKDRIKKLEDLQEKVFSIRAK